MKFMPLIFVFSLMFLTACQESSSKKSSSSNPLNSCVGTNYYTVPGCPGYSGGTTTGTTSGTTGGTTQICQQANNYYYYPGCPGFCQYYPSHAACVNGGTTGTTTGGTTPTNTCPTCPTTTNIGGWTGKYPGGVPTGTCNAAYAPSGIGYTPYETRKATMTVVGKTYYNPASGVTYMNTSSILQTVNTARNLFATDSVMKIRFKVKPQPESSNSSPYCTGRQSGSSIAGYTQLQYNVELVGLDSNGNQVGIEPLGTYITGVNSCTPAIDLSAYASQYASMYIRVGSVKGNQLYIPNDYQTNGFKNVTGFSDIRSQDCWVLDVEVAADGTKTFD